tara:strand:+ start:498 stop:1112 length:615 start_codon:yes stop_codon:yes gene_type:complete
MVSKKIINEYKCDPTIKINIKNSSFYLSPMTDLDFSNEVSISLLSEWRKASEHAFLKVFEVTNSGTQRWLKHGVIENKERLMFWVVDGKGTKVGHIGVSSFNYDECSCEVDNVIKSSDCNEKGLFTLVTESLIDWLNNNLNPKKIKLRVFSENIKAISLYKRVGFKPVDIITFKKVNGSDYVEWVESNVDIDRCFLTMEKFNDK